MIDPDGINITSTSYGNTIRVFSKEIEPCNIEIYNLDDEKEMEKFIRDIETQVRRSFEYKSMIKYLREFFGMDKCAFLADVSNRDSGVRIEIHHYPFSLRDITEIVIRKRKYYNESMELQMVSKEIMELHYKLLVGLISLSETVHELAHASKLFIPSDKVLGRFDLFVSIYKPFCDTQQLEVLGRIEKYSEELENPILNTTILEQNHLKYDINDTSFKLPDSENINTAMIEQMAMIKNNNYMLPSIDEIEEKEEEQKYFCPIRFIDKNNLPDHDIGFFGDNHI